jgi:hypothetical protein
MVCKLPPIISQLQHKIKTKFQRVTPTFGVHQFIEAHDSGRQTGNIYISASTLDRNEIPTVNYMFSRSTTPLITIPTSADIVRYRKQEGGRKTGSSCVQCLILENLLLGFGIKFGCSNMGFVVKIASQSCLEKDI